MARIDWTCQNRGFLDFQTPPIVQTPLQLRRVYINPPFPLSKSPLLFAYWLRSSVVSVLSSLITGSLALPSICYYPSFCGSLDHLWLATWFDTDGFGITLPPSAVDFRNFKDRDLWAF